MVLYQMCLLPIFSPRLWLVSSLSLTLSFTQQKFLILIKSRILILSFMNCAFGIVSKKSLSCLRSSRFPSVLSSRSFIPLCFKSVMNFELIFVKNFFYMRLSSCPRAISWRDYLFSIVLILLPCPVSVDWMGVYFQALILWHWSICLLFHQ